MGYPIPLGPLKKPHNQSYGTNPGCLMKIAWWPLANKLIPSGFLHCICFASTGDVRPQCKLLPMPPCTPP